MSRKLIVSFVSRHATKGTAVAVIGVDRRGVGSGNTAR
jgi:hypothetical protein